MNISVLRSLLVLLLISLTTANVIASDYADEIRQLCTTEKKRPARGELGRAITDANNYFVKNPPGRRDRQKSTAHLNEIVKHTSLAWTLQCPAKLKDVGYSFAIDFEATGDWHVTHDETKKIVTLGMSDRYDASGSILTYIHEMLHVCQFSREANTEFRDGYLDKIKEIEGISERNEYLTKTIRLKHQTGLADEVEAFFAMKRSFRELVRASPATCGGQLTWAGTTFQWFELWENDERQLESGTFAQDKLRNYVSNPRYSYSKAHEHIFEESQPEVQYYNDISREQFTLRPLHSGLRKLIEDLGVAVNDQPWDFRRHQSAFDIQVILKRTGCYTGKLDNKWGPGSRKALATFKSRTGASLPGDSPTLALWEALEGAVKQHEEACR